MEFFGIWAPGVLPIPVVVPLRDKVVAVPARPAYDFEQPEPMEQPNFTLAERDLRSAELHAQGAAITLHQLELRHGVGRRKPRGAAARALRDQAVVVANAQSRIAILRDGGTLPGTLVHAHATGLRIVAEQDAARAAELQATADAKALTEVRDSRGRIIGHRT